MKILMVSMFSNHFFRWTEQIENAGHEIYWLDVYDSNTQVKRIDFVNQLTGWRQKIKYPGRYTLKHKIPELYNLINSFNQRNLADVFEEKLNEIKPDVVHSFVMQSACFPILKIMQKNAEIPWVYSAWGNDLFFHQTKFSEIEARKEAFNRINYMFADCNRDGEIAKAMDFKGQYLGTFPTGGGYDFQSYQKHIVPLGQRNVILIKGYQHIFGRCIPVLQAVLKIQEKLADFEIVVFGAHPEVFQFVNKTSRLKNAVNFKVLGQSSHENVLKLMGRASIYIGNSISDGMPNTLLEAIVMEAFPIQSNPGGATGEIIEDNKNGFLIDDSDNVWEISKIIERAIRDTAFVKKAIMYNTSKIKPLLERKHIEKQVLEKYKIIEGNLK